MLYVFMYRPCVRGGSCVGANLHRVEPLSNVSHLKRVPTLSGPASCLLYRWRLCGARKIYLLRKV